MTVLLDNKTQGKVGDALIESIQANARLSILSGLFSVYGYSILKKQLMQAESLRLLVPLKDTLVSTDNEKPFHIQGLAGSEVGAYSHRQ